MKIFLSLIFTLLATVALANPLVLLSGSPPVTGGALTRTDDFNRTNANPIGGNWSTQNGFTAMQIVSNQVQGSTGGNYPDNGAVWTGDTFPNNQYSQVTYIVSDGYNGVGLITRGSSTSQTLYYLSIPTGGTAYFMRFVTGTFADVGNCSLTATNGDVFRLSSTGTTHTVYKNGSPASGCSWTDANIASGNPGIYSGTVGNNTLDNWEGGSL